MAKAKNDKHARRYVWFAIDDDTGAIYGLYKPPYNPWELSNYQVTYQRNGRIGSMPDSYRPDQKEGFRRRSWEAGLYNHKYLYDVTGFDKTKKQIEGLTFKNKNLRVICVRAGSNKCPAKLDWASALQRGPLDQTNAVNFTLKTS